MRAKTFISMKLKFFLTLCLSVSMMNAFAQELNLDSVFDEAESLSKKEKYQLFLDLAKSPDLRFDQQLIFIDSAVETAKQLRDRKKIFTSLMRKSHIFLLTNKLDSAITTLDHAEKFIDKGDLASRANYFLDYGQAYLGLVQYDSALSKINKGLDLAILVKDSLLITRAYGVLSYYHMSAENFSEAIRYIERGLTYYEPLDNTKSYSQLYYNLGFCYAKIKDYESALLYYLKAIDYTSDKKGLCEIYNAIGHIYSKLSKWNKAIEYYELAKINASDVGDTVYLAIIYTNIGASYKNKGEYDLAIREYKKALKLFSGNNNIPDLMSSLLLNLASQFNQIGQPDSALYYLGIAEKTLTGIEGNENIKARLLFHKGKAFSIKKYNSRALELLKLARSKAKSIDDKGLEIVILGTMAAVYENLNDYQKANDLLKNLKALSDTVSLQEHKNKVEELMTQYRVREKDKENKILQQQITINEQQIEKQKNRAIIITLIVIILIILLILSIVFIRYHAKALIKEKAINAANAKIYNQNLELKKKEKQILEEKSLMLKSDLERRKEEIRINTSELLKSSEMTGTILERIAKLRPYCNDEGKNMIRSTLAEFSHFSAEQNWNKFYRNFRETYPDFIKNLEELPVDFTDNERKIAIFLKMEMRRKEIAAITHQSLTSISVAKNRLRTKLGLPEKHELETFIKNL